jgi:hypothetical protein
MQRESGSKAEHADFLLFIFFTLEDGGGTLF